MRSKSTLLSSRLREMLGHELKRGKTQWFLHILLPRLLLASPGSQMPPSPPLNGSCSVHWTAWTFKNNENTKKLDPEWMTCGVETGNKGYQIEVELMEVVVWPGRAVFEAEN